MGHNYTPHDILATAAAVPVFAIFLVAPGYLFGWATNLLQFRCRSTSETFLLSVPFSIALSTMLANLAGRYMPALAILWLFIAMAVVVAFHLLRKCVHCFKEKALVELHASTKTLLVLTGLWTVGMIACLIDVQVGGKLSVNAAMYDHAVRMAFIHAALRSGPPPRNPFSYLGIAPVARYYYYWYVLCSYPVRLAHIDARYVFYGSTIWAGFSFAALIPIYLKDFFGVTEHLRRKSVLGILLLSITGLDIIPTVYEFLRGNPVSPDMEAWDPSQVTSWQDAFVWVPHHVASLVACLIGFLALWSVRKTGDGRDCNRKARIVAGIFAALAFAAGAGLSVYVTFTFALFLLCWGIRLLCKRDVPDFFLYLWTACLTGVLSLPYLHDLTHSEAAASVSQGGAAAKGPLAFGLRVLPNFLSTPYFLKVRGFSHPALFAPFGVLAVYVLEFGFFAVVGWKRMVQDSRKRSRLNEAEIAAWYLLAVGMFVITFIQSEVIANNDLAFRSAMIVQFVSLLWGADYLDPWIFSAQWTNRHRMTATNVAVVSTLLLGFIGTIYSLTMLRVYTVLDDRGMIAQPVAWLPPPPNVGAKLLDIRRAFGRLDRILPPGSIVQYNPMTEDYLPLLQYDKFQSVDAFPDCGTEFGGDASKCPPVQQAIANLFNNPGDSNIHELCDRLSIDALVARQSDPAWQDRKSWVWKNSPIVENHYIRAFQCR